MNPLATPRALKTTRPQHTPTTKHAVTYTGHKTLANANTGEMHPRDKRRIAASAHAGHVIVAVGDTAAVLTPLQAEQAAAALQSNANRARAQRRNGATKP